MSEGFLMNLDTARLFFRACSLYKINDKPRRLELLRCITSRKKAVYIRDPKEFIKGKRVLRITK